MPILTGDYNKDGTVDAANYIVWRANVGTSNLLPNDWIGGMIGQPRYEQWKENFGKSLARGLTTPAIHHGFSEPTTTVLLVTSAAFIAPTQGRRLRRTKLI